MDSKSESSLISKNTFLTNRCEVEEGANGFHEAPNPGAREGIPSLQLFDEAEKIRNCGFPGPYRETGN
jgi:hypothetical protein